MTNPTMRVKFIHYPPGQQASGTDMKSSEVEVPMPQQPWTGSHVEAFARTLLATMRGLGDTGPFRWRVEKALLNKYSIKVEGTAIWTNPTFALKPEQLPDRHDDWRQIR